MPDGSIGAQEIDGVAAMHRRLLQWGLCYLRGGAAVVDACRADIVRSNNKTGDDAEYTVTRTPYREPDPAFQRREWAQPQIDAARLLHNRVTALPIQRSLVLQVFYFQEDAEFWDEIGVAEQQQRIRDMTLWEGKPLGVNPRIVRHNRERYDNVPKIVPEAFMSIRHRAIRELVARERGIPNL